MQCNNTSMGVLACALVLVLAVVVTAILMSQADHLSGQINRTADLSAALPRDPLPPEIPIADLDARVRQAVTKAEPAVVAVRHTHLPSAASGVIISADGLVLSQWHVSHAVRDGTPNRTSWQASEKTVVILHDGRECQAELLGATRFHDLSLLRITEPGVYPFAPLREASAITTGMWILKLGHPGHYRAGRPPMARLGKVICRTIDGFATDCMINGGDSGGPYFDLDGNLVGLVRGASADTSQLLPKDHTRFNRYGTFIFAGTPNSVIFSDLDSMEEGKVPDLAGSNFDTPLLRAQRLEAENWSQGSRTLKPWGEIAAAGKSSVVQVLNGKTPIALATVVAAEPSAALLATKASELPDQPSVRLPDSSIVAANVVYTDSAFDIAILKVHTGALKPIAHPGDTSPQVGSLVAALGGDDLPIAIGIVAIPRKDSGPSSRSAMSQPLVTQVERLPVSHPALVGHPSGSGFMINYLADKVCFDAGLRVADVLVSLGGQRIHSDADISSAIAGKHVGDRLAAKIERDGMPMEFELPLTHRSQNGRNARSDGFPSEFEIAVPVEPSECGCPAVDVRGNAMGIIIARYDVEGCKVIPFDCISEILGRVH